MNLRLQFNRKYIAILMGGHPVALDKVMELVANKRQRVSFIYGIGMFIVYFYSDKPIKDIRDIFIATLKNDVDMIFVFKNTKNTVQHLIPNLKVRSETARGEHDNIAEGDINVLREIIHFIGRQMNGARFAPPMNQQLQQTPSDNDVSVSDEEIINELLMKMKATGYESLTPAELDFLKVYKDKHRKNKTDNEDVD